MRPARVGALVLGAGLAIGCGSRSAPSGETAPALQSDPTFQVTLERRACYGTCPIYRLTVTGDGSVTYEGVRYVAREGTAAERIPAQRVTELANAFREAGFDALPDRYVPGEPACGRYASDLPSVITSITRGGVTKRVEHDHGCAGAPGTLAVLEDSIDEAAESWRWTTGRRP